MLDFEQFLALYGLLVVIALANMMGAIFLWIAGKKKRSGQRMWARRLWSVNTFYVTILFVWSVLYLFRLP